MTASNHADDLSQWMSRPRPPRKPLIGRYVRLETITYQHLEPLFTAFMADTEGAMWTYLPYGPFADWTQFERFAETTYFGADPHFHVLIDRVTDAPLGVASLMRIVPDHGVIEVGHIALSPLAQRTRLSTEAVYLFFCLAFDALGYRRFEWKCNNANAASKQAAIRFGFTPEGVFRQERIFKGQNRDTAWFSLLDHEWPAVKAAFETWLDPVNFDDAGQQRSKLDTWIGRKRPQLT